MLGMPPLLSSVWFKPDEQNIAISIGVTSNILGSAAGYCQLWWVTLFLLGRLSFGFHSSIYQSSTTRSLPPLNRFLLTPLAVGSNDDFRAISDYLLYQVNCLLINQLLGLKRTAFSLSYSHDVKFKGLICIAIGWIFASVSFWPWASKFERLL